MNYLLVAATHAEIKPLTDHLNISEGDNVVNGNRIFILVTGVGMVATAFSLGAHLANKQYDLAINLGICGSFDRSLALGDLVNITEDTIAELGAEDDTDFITIDNLGFGQSNFHPINPQIELGLITKVSAITVNKVHGNESSIAKTAARLNPQVESMEGAAFFYSCNQYNLASMQVRAISNYVERRNRDNWKIGLAVKNLNDFAIRFLEH